VGSSFAHALAYSAYVWMVGRAGAVFAAQVSYLVTAFGIFWAWVILGETYSGWVWASQRRVLRRNADLSRSVQSPWATEEQFALFRRYLDVRHADGGMADMDIFEFAAMIEETPVRSHVIEYRGPPEPGEEDGPLLATALTDLLDDGLSMVYSFYEPDQGARSFGTHLILDHVALVREIGLPYVYLGYWVPGSRKMDYKARMAALEIYKDGVWQDIGDPASHCRSRSRRRPSPWLWRRPR
jgi:arginyl-tRNA--protein-N-Asp/Glu arginylyltransferase